MIPPMTTWASSERWLTGATGWYGGSWSRNALICNSCRQPRCRSTSTTGPGCASGAPSSPSTSSGVGRTYTVPSRLIGKEVQIRLYAEHLEVYYKDHLVERMERVRGEREARVDYRHIIGSLVRKPGAFARYRFREQLFPTMTFRLSYDALKRWRGDRADVEYVRILHLSATTMESTVDSALALLLEAGDPFDYGTVKELANPAPPRAPVLNLPGMPDLRVYDSLLAGVA